MKPITGRRNFIKYFSSMLAFVAGTAFSFGKNFDPVTGKAHPTLWSTSAAEATENAVSGMKKIAVEEHFTTEKILTYLAARVKAGAVYNMPLPYTVDAHRQSMIGEKRFKDMDEAGIDMQVISPVCFQDGLVDPAEAAALAKLTNDELAKIIETYPKRFYGFAALACQDPDAAARELERAVQQLKLKGAMIYSHIQGEYLDGSKFRCIFETAERLGVPIYLHPKEPSPGMIKPYEVYPLLEGKAWGYAAEAGLHAMRLIASGLFDEHPRLQIILGHGGEGLPYWLWRMGSGEGLGEEKEEKDTGRPGMPGGTSLQKPLAVYVRNNFYASTSGMAWGPVLQFLHTAMGPDRVLFAVDYPSESNIRAVKAVASLPIGDEDRKKIFYLNTKRLLRL